MYEEEECMKSKVAVRATLVLEHIDTLLVINRINHVIAICQICVLLKQIYGLMPSQFMETKMQLLHKEIMLSYQRMP